MAKGSKPSFIVRAKVGKDNHDNDIFITVGAAWPFNSGTGYNINIQSLPVNFDGHLMMVEPKEE